MSQSDDDQAPVRIVIVDDHAMMREGLRLVIERQPGMTIVGEAANRAEALPLAERGQPDIILLDLDLGEERGLDLLPELFAVAPSTRVLILTGVRNRELHQRAVYLGALGIVLKGLASELLVKAIEKVHAGEVWLDGAMIATVLTTLARPQLAEPIDLEAPKIATLPPREREVITLISEGFKDRRIAERLAISEVTVNHHLTSIFNKLGVPSRLELVVYAYRHGLVEQAP